MKSTISELESKRIEQVICAASRRFAMFAALGSAGWIASFSAISDAHESNGEYFGARDPEIQAMADRLHANAHNSPQRFEDISMMATWYIGSCRSGNHVLHFRAYFASDCSSYIGVFGPDEQL